MAWHSFASNWKMYTMCCAMSFSDGCSIFYILFQIGVCRCVEHPIVWAQTRFPSRIISRHIYIYIRVYINTSMCIASSQRFYGWETFQFKKRDLPSFLRRSFQFSFSSPGLIDASPASFGRRAAKEEATHGKGQWRCSSVWVAERLRSPKPSF